MISHSPNQWSNKETMIEYIAEVIAPYVEQIVPFMEQKRVKLELSNDHAAVAVFDHFKR